MIKNKYILFVVIVVVFCGCMPSKEQYWELQAHKITMASLQLLINKNHEIDSLTQVIDDCKHTQLLKASN